MIDLSRMRGVRVDLATKTVRAEGGALWGDVDHESQAFGLATSGGVVSTTNCRDTVALSFPTASIALTKKAWVPSESGVVRVDGEPHPTKGRPV